MNKKKVFLAVLALILVCSLSVAGTLAYLTATQTTPVVNTFVAAGGGKIITDGQNSFKLVESVVEYIDAEEATPEKPVGYYRKDGTETFANSYDMAVPNMEIPKDPKLTVDLEAGIEAYIFVKVTDTTQGNLHSAGEDTYELTDDWKPVTIAGFEDTEALYLYKGGITTGDAEVELTGVGILKDNKIFVKNVDGKTTNFVDTDAAATGVQLGQLKFEAYACQAAGFADAAAAYTACFGSNP